MNNFNSFSLTFNILDGAALLFVAICAVWYLNQRHYRFGDMRGVAIVLVAGCALGQACAFFWPGYAPPGLTETLRLGIDLGLALVFLAMAWGRVQTFFGESPLKTFHRNALELATHARTNEEWEMVRLAAAAALRLDGIDRRVGRQNDASDIEPEGIREIVQ